MPTYPFSAEPWLWSAYRATVSTDQTLDEPIRECILERVAEEHDDPTIRDRAADLLEGS